MFYQYLCTASGLSLVLLTSLFKMPHIPSGEKKNAFNCPNTIDNNYWLRHVSVEKGKIKHNDLVFFSIKKN